MKRSAYEKWRDKKLPKKIQAEVDGFANGPLSADERERAFRAGWLAYKLLSPLFEKEAEGC